MTALAWRLLVADPLLLSGLGVAWFAGGVALSAQREVLPSTERGGRWGGAFAGVTTYVTVTLQQSLSLPAGRSFAVSLTVLGLVAFAVGAGSALTVRVVETA